jgi:hypothetical protein
MMLLWTTSDRLASRVIRWASYSEFSHFAICFDWDDQGNGIVFHSGPRGTEIVWLRQFLSEHRIIHALEFWEPLTLEREEKVYKAILKTEAGRAYDFQALAWWVLRAMLRRAVGLPLPQVNQWQDGARRLCTGIAPAVINALGIVVRQKIDFEMIPLDTLYHFFWSTHQFQLPKKIPSLAGQTGATTKTKGKT